jgi:hypothetical protein
VNNLITIIFSTFNGAYTLPKMLDSLQEVARNTSFEWNVIAVDNNSTDNTKAILKSYETTLPIEILAEVKAGKNICLNRAIKDKTKLADYIIFTDDDVIFSPSILNDYKALIQQHEDYDVFGGKVSPYWVTEPSKNLLLGINCTVAFALTNEDAGYVLGPIEGTKIHGPNMAVRKSVFDQGISFNEHIGPNGGNYVMGSETDFLRRLNKAGHNAFFAPQIVVGHIIRPWQLESKWLASRAFKAGRSLVNHQLNQDKVNKVALFCGYPRWALAKYLKDSFKFYFQFGIKNISYYEHLWARNHIKGYLFEYKYQNTEVNLGKS